jgi:hypothetical protein
LVGSAFFSEYEEAAQRTRVAVERAWGRVKELIKTAQLRVEQVADKSPGSIILGMGIAAFGVGIALRVWRSNRYARNQFFGKWRT